MKKFLLSSMLTLAVAVTPTAFASDVSSPTQSSISKTEATQLLLQVPLEADTYKLSSGFGERIDPETKVKTFHNGIDYAAPKGTAIFAANDGVIILADSVKGYGETIIIKHNAEFTTLYGHILPGSFLVKVGDTVKKGQKIAEVGSSEATGSQLHFSVFKNGIAVNPNDYFKSK